MRRYLVLLLALLMTATVADAQCGNPCEPVKWPLPTWPGLISPTPLVPGSASVLTPTVAPTATPSPTLTAVVDTDDLNSAFSTLQSVMSGTLPSEANPSGTPYGLDELLSTAEADTSTFFGTARGILTANVLGPFEPLGVLALVIVAIVIVLKSSTLIFTIMAPLLGIVRKIVSLVLDFLPF